MMRSLRSLFCLVIVLSIISACTSSHSTEIINLEPSNYETVNNLEGMQMMIKDGTVSPTGLTLIFEISSEKQYSYGGDFLLEKKINDKWYQVLVVYGGNYAFADISYGKEMIVNWDWLYGSLDTGEYRIVKEIQEFRNNGDYDTHHLTAEFTIN
nr:immunoglobulin-like domain-containing protein [Lysinibacillus timonensis]